MSEPYVGEIRMVPFTFAPVGWFLCQGQLLQIAEYNTLFALIGTTYGGDGQTTFGLPDLQGRAPLHTGSGGGASYSLGTKSGTETVPLTPDQIPAHIHPIGASSGNGSASSPASLTFASSTLGQYATSSTGVSAAMLSAGPAAQPHENRMPYLTINYIISAFGIFPSQS